jgi:hypothetical protein
MKKLYMLLALASVLAAVGARVVNHYKRSGEDEPSSETSDSVFEACCDELEGAGQ